MSIVDFYAIFLAGILHYYSAKVSHIFGNSDDSFISAIVILAGCFLGNVLGITLFEDNFFALPKYVLTYTVAYYCVFLFGSLQPKSDNW